MDNDLLKYAYAALLHDIGKFYQRTEIFSQLNENEKAYTPIHENGYHTHVHSGYTYKFFEKYLQSHSDIERASSSHHIYSSDNIDMVVQKADRIASKVDRSDENHDNENEYERTKFSYITSRLNSIMYEINFGKPRYAAVFPLTTIDKITLPKQDYIYLNAKQSALEYKTLFQQFIQDVQKEGILLGNNVTPIQFNRMYALLYQYTTLIPASTYETNCPTVSLFDHLKLTSAIASCLYYNKKEEFYMVEFDISGIQKFIYHITEGNNTKPKLTKSLRGRSAFVSILTNSITYALLNEFHLTQANIIFNTGGGAVILLPNLDDTKERVERLFTFITEILYRKFNTNLTFVYAIEKLDKDELEMFKSEKALSLKTKLDEEKHRKFLHIIDDDFSFQSLENEDICPMCGDNLIHKHEYCDLCEMMIEISDKYTQSDQMSIWYDFNHSKGADIDLEFVSIHFLDKNDRMFYYYKDFFYLDAINHFEYGNVKMVANLVPKEMSFEEIALTLGKEYGDQKLAILKMDVDNLGAIFAFGLKQNENTDITLQRSLSKYLTLSRFMELFFSLHLKNICLKVSQELQDKYKNIFYINYAGGDDLVIMGPVYGIVVLAKRIHEAFINFVCNSNITLSAGIHIQTPKKPIRFGVQMADDALESSKSFREKGKIVKNAITIMGITVSFEDYLDILNKVDKYRQYILDSKISRTSFYNIMSHIQVKNMDEFYTLIPKIQYMLLRQISYQPVRIEFLKEITQISDEYKLNKIVLMMKLVILFTREVN